MWREARALVVGLHEHYTGTHMTWGPGGCRPRGWAWSPGGRCGRGPWGGPGGTGGQLESNRGIGHK